MRPFDATDVPEELARWLPAGATLAFPEQGMTSSVAFTSPGDAVFKRCADPLYLDWIRREREVLDALAEAHLPVPRVLDYLDLGSEVWIVMTRLPGVPCARVLSRADRTARLGLLVGVGEALRRLHDTPPPEPLRTESDWIERKLAEAHRNLAWCDGNRELLERLRLHRPSPVQPTLVHGDLNLENLLVENGTVTGFVDWAGGDFGDPRYDVALSLLSDEDLVFDDAMLRAFSEGYGSNVDRDVRAWFEGLYEFF